MFMVVQFIGVDVYALVFGSGVVDIVVKLLVFVFIVSQGNTIKPDFCVGRTAEIGVKVPGCMRVALK